VKQCPRCDHWHHSVVSDICDLCWEDMGQMHLWPPEDEAIPAVWEDDEYGPVIDTIFDREEEARGYQ